MNESVENEYSPEAIRQRLAQQHGLTIEGQSSDQTGTSDANAGLTDSDIFNKIDAAEKARNAQIDRDNPYSIGPKSVGASIGLAALHNIGQKIGVVPSNFYNAQTNLYDINNRLNFAQQNLENAIQHTSDWEQQQEWLHSPHAMNEYLPEEHQIPIDGAEYQGQTRTERNVQGENKPEIGTGRERGTAYNARTAQEAARLREQEELYKRLGLDPRKVLSNFEDVTSTPSGQLISKSTGEALNAEQSAKHNEAKLARERARLIIDPQKQEAAEQVRLGKIRQEQAANAVKNISTEENAARTALAAEKSGMNPFVRRIADSMSSGAKYMPEIVHAGARVASKYLGPLAAASAPENFGQGWNEMRTGEYGRGLAHIGGGLGGLAALAPLAVGAGLMAPEIGLGVAGAGALASIPALGYDVGDLYNKFTGHK